MDSDQQVEYLLEFWRLTGSPAYPTPADEMRRLVVSWVERSCDAAANIRQFAAMVQNGSRSHLLATIDRPTLVIHGEEDPLIPADGGRHTAACIRNAQLRIIPGMGHDLPEQLIPELARLIAGHCAEAQNGATDNATVVAASA